MFDDHARQNPSSIKRSRTVVHPVVMTLGGSPSFSTEDLAKFWKQTLALVSDGYLLTRDPGTSPRAQ